MSAELILNISRRALTDTSVYW